MLIPPAKIHGLEVAPIAYLPSNHRPAEALFGLYVESEYIGAEVGGDMDGMLSKCEERIVVAWFVDRGKAEAAKDKLMEMLTLDLSFLASPTWGALDNEKGGA